MAKKKPPFKFLLRLLFAIPAIMSLASKVFTLIKIEARESGRNFVKIVILAIFSLIVLSSTWISALAILFFYLLEWHLTVPAALGILLAVNLLSLFIIMLSIVRSKKRLFFPETRRQLRGL